MFVYFVGVKECIYAAEVSRDVAKDEIVELGSFGNQNFTSYIRVSR
mgnify:CR=1 FL=1